MLNGLNIIELHRYTHRCSTLPKGLVDSLPNAQTAVKGNKIFAVQLAYGYRLHLCKRMRTVAHEYHPFGMPRNDGHGTVWWRKREDSQIGFVVDHRFDDLVRMQIRQAYLRLRVPRSELLAVDSHIV